MDEELAVQISLVGEAMGELPAGLRAHIGRVAVEADGLATAWDVDPDRMKLAVLGHDLFRAVPENEQVGLARQIGVRVGKADRASPIVLHGAIAEAVLRERFRVTDEEVLAAIAQHTLGGRTMPLMSKILLIADKVESLKRRRDPAMKVVRKLARRDLDLALLCWADWKWVEERTHGWDSHPTHWKARKTWVRQHHREIAAGLR